jgi:hypothetical protein
VLVLVIVPSLEIGVHIAFISAVTARLWLFTFLLTNVGGVYEIVTLPDANKSSNKFNGLS